MSLTDIFKKDTYPNNPWPKVSITLATNEKGDQAIIQNITIQSGPDADPKNYENYGFGFYLEKGDPLLQYEAPKTQSNSVVLDNAISNKQTPKNDEAAQMLKQEIDETHINALVPQIESALENKSLTVTGDPKAKGLPLEDYSHGEKISKLLTSQLEALFVPVPESQTISQDTISIKH